MGCLCSKQKRIMDTSFIVKYKPQAAADFLALPENWLHIIPDAINHKNPILSLNPSEIKKIQSYNHSEIKIDWSLQADLKYEFYNTTQSQPNVDTEIWLEYCVLVTGKSSGLPVSFNFQVRYEFIPNNYILLRGGSSSSDSTTVFREVTNLSVNSCTCVLGLVIPSSLKQGLAKENLNMITLMSKN